MNAAGHRVREARKDLGVSQLELAQLSGVSLATIQALEAGRANPSLAILARILDAVGLELCLVPVPADWDALADHGLALSRSSSRGRTATPAGLLRQLRLAAREVDGDRLEGDAGRKLESLQALLLALETSFPDLYRKWFGRSLLIDRLTPRDPGGRVIKLKRIAERRLSELL